jgi:hypothetical protein
MRLCGDGSGLLTILNRLVGKTWSTSPGSRYTSIRHDFDKHCVTLRWVLHKTFVEANQNGSFVVKWVLAPAQILLARSSGGRHITEGGRQRVERLSMAISQVVRLTKV